MKTRVLAFLVAFLGLVVSASAFTLQDLNKLVSQTNFIVNDGCSGTLISVKHRLILTNHHCIADFYSFVEKEEVGADGTVKKVTREEKKDVPISQRAYSNGRNVGTLSYLTELVAHKKGSDLALLQIRAKEIPHTMETKMLPEGEQASRGEMVYVVGNPAGLDGTIVNGNISSMDRTQRFPWTDSDVRYIQFAGGVWFGNSGGSLLNAKGEMIGVPFMIAGTAHLGGAVHYDFIRGFLSDNCYGLLWSPKADDYETCIKKKEDEKAKKKEK